MVVRADQYKGPKEFVHLHNHTVYSTLDGVATPDQYAEECKTRGYPAMSATEHGNMASVPDMYLSFKKHGVKYIPGCEIYYNNDHIDGMAARDMSLGKKALTANRANQSDDQAVWDKYLRYWRSRHVTVLAKNQTGFENLIKLTTDANRLGTFRSGRPGRLWFDLLCKYKEGLIVLSGCLNGPIAHELRKRESIRVKSQVGSSGKQNYRIKEQGKLLDYPVRMQNALVEFKKWKSVFRKDYMIELQMPVIRDRDIDSHPESRYSEDMVDLEVFEMLLEIGERSKTPIILTNDCHYLKREDHSLQRLMMAIEQGVDIDSKDLFASDSSEQYMKTRADLWATWKNYPYCRGKSDSLFESMCDNTLMVADCCKPLKMDTSPKIPIYNDADVALRNKTYQALRESGLDKETRRWLVDGRMVTYTDQVEIELERFISKGFSSYFLITSDLVGFGKSRGYPFGPRGSAGGSLVCMLLNIHSLDPLKWQLSFDRFMSPSRGGFMLKVNLPE